MCRFTATVLEITAKGVGNGGAGLVRFASCCPLAPIISRLRCPVGHQKSLLSEEGGSHPGDVYDVKHLPSDFIRR